MAQVIPNGMVGPDGKVQLVLMSVEGNTQYVLQLGNHEQAKALWDDLTGQMNNLIDAARRHDLGLTVPVVGGDGQVNLAEIAKQLGVKDV